MNSKYREERHRPPYYLLTGLLLGLLIGFAVTFILLPVQYSNVPPETLQSVDKDQYRLMIAYAFKSDQDIGRANARLGLLREENLSEVVLNQAQRSERRSDAQILLNLSEALKETPSTVATMLPPTPQTIIQSPTITKEPTKNSITETIIPTIQTIRTATEGPTESVSTKTPFPSPTTINSSTIPFRLSSQKIVCNPNYLAPYIQIEVFDKSNNPMANIRVLVSWDGGQDIFYTGYFPEISSGYADFEIEPSIAYSIRIGEIGEVVDQIIAPECKDDSGNTYWGTVYLDFSEP
ncbi:MAG: hypothetical protein ACYDH1_10035 [Anaerolineaceae bacterium]